MDKQKINCTVNCCEHLDKTCECCKLDCITVVSDTDCPTAHYCHNYKKK